MKKGIIITLSLLALLLVSAIALPYIFKDKIVALVKDESNKNVNATIEFSDVDLTLFNSFPKLTVIINDLSIVNKEPFVNDTLLSTKEFGITLGLLSVIKGEQMDIYGIYLDKPRIQLMINESGIANWDIALTDSSEADSDTSASSFKMSLQKYSISDAYLLYDDKSLGFKTELKDFNHSGKGNFTQDNFVLQTETKCQALNLWYENVKYLSEVNTNITADIDMNIPNFTFTFKENKILLNELAFGVDGFVSMPNDDIDMDLKFDVKQNEFKHFLSLIPGMYSDNFKDLKSSGALSFSGFLRGTYNDTQMPGFQVALNIKDGMFQYPSLPSAVNNVQVDLLVDNPDGNTDHTIINLKKFHAELGKEPFDASLLVKTPISDPDLNAIIKGKINFSNLSDIIPLEANTSLSGLMNIDLNLNTRMSYIDKKMYEKVNAEGLINVTDVVFKSTDYPEGISIKTTSLGFNPRSISLSNLNGTYKNSDFKANGALDNVFSWMLKNETLVGTLNLESTKLDLNDFMVETESSSASTADSSTNSIIKIPGGIDFTLFTDAKEVRYDNITLSDFNGKIIIRDEAVLLDNINTNLLGGSLRLNGKYTAKNDQPKVDFSIGLKDFDIQATSAAFASIRQLAPIAKYAKGLFSSELSFSTNLDESLMPVFKTMFAKGKLNTSNVSVDGFTPMEKVASTLKMEQFKKFFVDNVNLSFYVKEGRAYVEPFIQNIGGTKALIQGSTGTDMSLNYDMKLDIPTKYMGNAAQSHIQGLLGKANSSLGTNVSMGESVKVNLLLSGLINNPSIKTDLSDQKASLQKNLEDQAKAELEKQKAELEAKVKAEADKLKSEAEAKAKEEADKLKKEAELKAQQELNKLNEQLKKEAEDKLKNLFKKPK